MKCFVLQTLASRSSGQSSNSIYNNIRDRTIRNDTSPTTIGDLNDDCLREIFTHLNISQLCLTSIACKRFHSISEEILRKRFKSIDLSDREKMGRSNSHCGYKLGPLSILFQKYEINELAFSKHDFAAEDTQIINMISKSCRDVRSLQMKYMTFYSWGIHLGQLRTLFQGLNSLTMDLCTFYLTRAEMTSIFSKCVDLTSLVLVGPNVLSYIIFWSQIEFPKLITLKTGKSFSGSYIQASSQISFFKKHPNIKHLQMRRLTFSVWKASLPNLESLHTQIIDDFPSNIGDLPCLDNLKKLTLTTISNKNFATFMRAIAAKNKLEYFGFHAPFIEYKELIRSVLRVKSLRSLTIGSDCNITEENLSLLFRNIPEISVSYKFEFSKSENNA